VHEERVRARLRCRVDRGLRALEHLLILRGVLIAAACLVALMVSGCGSSPTYSTEAAQRAFSRHGLPLVSVTDQMPHTSNGSGLATLRNAAFVTRNGEDFLVLVLSDSHADKAWDAYVAVGPHSDSFDARRANVLVIADNGVSADARKRIVAALASLPDHGDRVATLRMRR